MDFMGPSKVAERSKSLPSVLELKAVSVEAMGKDGKWVLVLDQLGYPAGMSRQMVIPLAKDRLPKGCRRIRLSTNQEIYWDRIFVAFAEKCPGAKKVEMPLVGAKLLQSGFALRKDGRRPDYQYGKRVPLWDTRAQEGFYTRFGDWFVAVCAVIAGGLLCWTRRLTLFRKQ